MHSTDAPLIVHVARFRLDDGPGIRSVVFFKGCELRCSFCHNPEAQRKVPEFAVTPERCLVCQSCVRACPTQVARPAQHEWASPEGCIACGACAAACPTSALRRVGTLYSVAELAELLLRDRAYYAQSGGGVTLSGGEPGLFPQYVGELLGLLKAEGVHVLLQTSGHFTDYPSFQQQVLPLLDAIDFSLKLADPEAHRAMSGQDNTLVLANLRRLATEAQVPLLISIPLVPGLTTTPDNLRALAEIARDLGIQTVRLLPYNPVAAHRRPAQPHRAPPALPKSFMTPDEVAAIAAQLRSMLDE